MGDLAKLEKNKLIWWLIVLCTIFILLRLPSIIEPYWYGDEGVYEIIGLAMNHGRILYQGIWDNKPPLLYIIYALANGDQSIVKIYSIIVGLFTVAAFFSLAQNLFKNLRISITSSLLFIIFFATPILEANIANAEDFLLLPVILGGLLIYNFPFQTKNKQSKYTSFLHSNSKYSILISGLLLGIAFLLKTVAIFDFAAFIIFFLLVNPTNISMTRINRKSNISLKFYIFLRKTLNPNSIFMILGFLIPLLITIVYFAFNHAFQAFYQAVFFGNISYVGYQNVFWRIPQGLLLIKIIILLISLSIIFIKRKILTKPILFLLLWLIFSLFNVYFSQRPYTHYVIVLIPSFCLLIGLLFENNSIKKKVLTISAIIVIILLIFVHFQFNYVKSYLYYPNAINFLTNNESVRDYQSFFDPHVPRDYEVAAFINKNTVPTDKVFIWGNNPQIYTLSHKLPPGKYTVAYHIIQNNAFLQTQQAIISEKPKYIIALKEIQPLPFVLPIYIMRYNIEGAYIYERSF